MEEREHWSEKIIRSEEISSLRRRRRQPVEGSTHRIALALLSLALSGSAPQHSAGARAEDMTVVGSYGTSQFRGRSGLAKPENIDYTKLSRIHYGPFQVDARGNVWGTDADADPRALFGPRHWNPPQNAATYCHQSSLRVQQCNQHFYEKGLIGMAHENGVEVYPVVGGAEWSDKFSEMAADPEARLKFAQNAALLMKSYDFDGLDMAWQFPKSFDDMSNYGIVLQEVRTALNKEGQDRGREYGLTATLPCGHGDPKTDHGQGGQNEANGGLWPTNLMMRPMADPGQGGQNKANGGSWLTMPTTTPVVDRGQGDQNEAYVRTRPAKPTASPLAGRGHWQIVADVVHDEAKGGSWPTKPTARPMVDRVQGGHNEANSESWPARRRMRPTNPIQRSKVPL